MMRWVSAWCGMVLAVCLATGCGSRTFLSKDVFDQALDSGSLLPPSMEKNYKIGEQPLTDPSRAPATINAPDRPPRYLSLQEAIAIALESGTASIRGGAGTGLYDMQLATSPPGLGAGTINLTSQTDNLRVLALNPALSGANVEAALSRFDAHWISLMTWNVADSVLQGLSSFQNGTTATGSTSIVKALPSGGFISTTLGENYQQLSQPPTTGGFSILNPLYTSSVTVGFEQPLWRNAGVRINELLSGQAAPTTNIGVPGNVAGQLQQTQPTGLLAGQSISNDGILIARLRFDQSRAEFERVVQGLVLQVEVAYWNLYNAYGQLYAYEESLRIAHRTWMIAYSKGQVGAQTDAETAPVRGQYEEFRAQRTTALGLVLEAERNLRGILGLPVEDGTRIVPMTPPALALYAPDWDAAVRDALNLRPELVLARDNLRLAQYNIEIAENFLKPDVRFAAQYAPTGYGTTLSGRGTFLDGNGAPQNANSLESLGSGHFVNTTVGLVANVPIGFRLENAAMRAARISLAQNYYLVKDQEQKAMSYCYQQYEKLGENYSLIQIRKEERKAYALAVEVFFRKIKLGKGLPDVDFRDIETKLAAAQVAEYQAIAEYNNTLARFEFAKGTILKYNNVHIAEGQMPQCVQVRAVEHEKERNKAILLHERPDPLTHPGRLADTQNIPASDVPLPLAVFNRPPEVEYPPIPQKQGETIEALPKKLVEPAAPQSMKTPPGQGFLPVEKLDGPAPSSLPAIPPISAMPMLPAIPSIPAMPVVPAVDASSKAPVFSGSTTPALPPAQTPPQSPNIAMPPGLDLPSNLPGVIPAPTLQPSAPPMGNAPRN